MAASTGNEETDMYSLPEAVLFLLGTPWNAPLLEPGFRGSINWIDVSRLSTWLRDVIGDADLAAAVDKHVVPLESYMAQLERLPELLSKRMDQYREVRAATAASHPE